MLISIYFIPTINFSLYYCRNGIESFTCACACACENGKVCFYWLPLSHSHSLHPSYLLHSHAKLNAPFSFFSVCSRNSFHFVAECSSNELPDSWRSVWLWQKYIGDSEQVNKQHTCTQTEITSMLYDHFSYERFVSFPVMSHIWCKVNQNEYNENSISKTANWQMLCFFFAFDWVNVKDCYNAN